MAGGRKGGKGGKKLLKRGEGGGGVEFFVYLCVRNQ